MRIVHVHVRRPCFSTLLVYYVQTVTLLKIYAYVWILFPAFSLFFLLSFGWQRHSMTTFPSLLVCCCTNVGTVGCKHTTGEEEVGGGRVGRGGGGGEEDQEKKRKRRGVETKITKMKYKEVVRARPAPPVRLVRLVRFQPDHFLSLV